MDEFTTALTIYQRNYEAYLLGNVMDPVGAFRQIMLCVREELIHHIYEVRRH